MQNHTVEADFDGIARRDLAGMVADSDVFAGKFATREEALAVRLGSTSSFLRRALVRRIGSRDWAPLVLVG
jgi:hypothetical protein